MRVYVEGKANHKYHILETNTGQGCNVRKGVTCISILATTRFLRPVLYQLSYHGNSVGRVESCTCRYAMQAKPNDRGTGTKMHGYIWKRNAHVTRKSIIKLQLLQLEQQCELKLTNLV